MSKFGEPSSGRLVKQTTSNGTESRECAGCMRALPLRARFDCSRQHCRFERDINHHEMEIRFNEEHMFFGLRDTSNILLLRSTRSSQSFTVSLMTVQTICWGLQSVQSDPHVCAFELRGKLHGACVMSFVESAPQSKHTPSPSQKDLHLRGIVDSPPAQEMTGDVPAASGTHDDTAREKQVGQGSREVNNSSRTANRQLHHFPQSSFPP